MPRCGGRFVKKQTAGSTSQEARPSSRAKDDTYYEAKLRREREDKRQLATALKRKRQGDAHVAEALLAAQTRIKTLKKEVAGHKARATAVERGTAPRTKLQGVRAATAEGGSPQTRKTSARHAAMLRDFLSASFESDAVGHQAVYQWLKRHSSSMAPWLLKLTAQAAAPPPPVPEPAEDTASRPAAGP